MSSAAAPRWALVAVLLVGVLLGGAGHAAVLGIDLGTLFIKTSAVAPGFAFTIVLDEASKRAMPAIVAFGGEQRLYGTNAKERLAKSPDAAFAWTRRLLGKPFGCPQQQQLIDAGTGTSRPGWEAVSSFVAEQGFRMCSNRPNAGRSPWNTKARRIRWRS